tara:strand:- start:441 stop:1475 length:1035 start_codon:yes stop_codon:yes gene_type:complete
MMNWIDRAISLNIIPIWLYRIIIRFLISKKIKSETTLFKRRGRNNQSMITFLSKGPIATHTHEANEQHYCVPPHFFQSVLGPHLKYSCCYWDKTCDSLSEAELAMLELSIERSKIEDGHTILELGCGWGSLTLLMAKKFPNSSILAMSNSSEQKQYIEEQLTINDMSNVQVITENIADFCPDQTFDRIVSIEMFEHLSNYKLLFEKLNTWLNYDGYIFVHIFGHKYISYPFVNKSSTDWMARHFFSGGVMPSESLFTYFENELLIANKWRVNGVHYQKTANAWLKNLVEKKQDLFMLFKDTYGPSELKQKWSGWVVFFIACAELFGFNKGNDYMVFHYLIRKKI